MVFNEIGDNTKTILENAKIIGEHVRNIALSYHTINGVMKAAFNIAVKDFTNKTQKNSEPEQNLICLSNKGDEQIMKFKGVSVLKKPNTNIYWARVRIKKKLFIVYGRTQKECYDKLKQVVLNGYIVNNDANNEKTYHTLKSWYEYYMKTYKIDSKEIREGTIKDNNRVFNNFKKYENKKLNDFNESLIKEIINRCNGDREKQKAFILLKSLFSKAKDNNIIKNHPMVNLSKPQYKAPEKKAFTIKQQEIFLKACANYSNKIHGDFLAICLLQGLTRGECWALTLKKVDFEKNEIVIDECIKESSADTKTKNQYRTRTIPMFEQTKKILLKYKDIKGKFFNIKSWILYNDLKNICLQNNLPCLTIHELRHTFITRCQELNIPLYIIQSWVGHAKGSKVTTSTYTHITSDMNKKFSNVLNDFSRDLGTQ